MAGWVFCNRCFQPPHRASRFSLTNCGHVYCDVCLRKGGKDECLICKVPCRTLLLSKHTDVDIQALFMGIDGLCKKYSRETSQVSEFQEKHRRRLLAFYREKIARLEESLQKSVLRMEQLQSMRLSQEPVLGAMKTPVSTPSAKPAGHLLLRLESSASDRVESMQVDRTPSPTRKPEGSSWAGQNFPDQPTPTWTHGVSHGGPQLPGLTPSLSSVSQALRIPALQVPCRTPQAQGPAGVEDSPSLAGFRVLAPRPPISISALLQRQHVGSAGLRGAAHGR